MAADLLYIVDDNGEMRFLGNIEPKDVQIKAKWPVYGDTATTPLIPKSKWDDYCISIDQAIESFFLPPVHDQNGVGMCFPPGTKITKDNGTQVNIEDIQVGDLVFTAECNVKKVTRVMSRLETKKLYSLLVLGHRHLWATEEHPILTKRGYIKISELNIEDLVAVPKLKNSAYIWEHSFPQPINLTYSTNADTMRASYFTFASNKFTRTKSFTEEDITDGIKDDKYWWRPISSIGVRHYRGIVYNLEVEDDHSYIAEGIGVHNCNASATTAAMEARRAKQSLDYIKLSSGDLYGRINGGSDSGSLLEDGLSESMSTGVASVKTVPYLEWRNINNGAIERPKYRVLEAFLCPTFEHVFSAAAGGCDIISGILWYSNYTPDSDGWLPSPYGQAGGHAVYGFAPTKRRNTYGIIHQNSWGQWGYKRRGFCVFPESVYNNAIGGWWAVRSVVDEGGIVPGS